MITYGSVCSGIEAASVAWEGLGWQAAWFAEIEKFPSAVLAHQYPYVPNLGDMTKIAAAVRAGTVPAPAVMVGGTPCQAFSIAGLRKSLDDPRGQLSLAYIDLANAIDEKRESNGDKPAIHLWENVPGSLSTDDNAFGYFLAGLAGEDQPFEPGPRPEPGKNGKCWRWKKTPDAGKGTGKHVAKWPKSGCVYGRQRRLAWRILDAQYFGVAQRRRRVFIVASARDDIDPAEILLEFNGVRRDSPPSREPGAQSAAAAATGARNGSHWDCEHNPHPTLNQSHNTGGIGASNQEIFAQRGSGLVPYFNGQARNMLDGPTVGTNAAHSFTGGAGGRPEGAAAGHFIPMAFGGGNCSGSLDVAACLTAKGQRNDFDVETFAVQSAICTESDLLMDKNQKNVAAHTLHGEVDVFPTVATRFNVRRITPKECERLQGFPDGWTFIPENKRKTITADELAYVRKTYPDISEEEANRRAADGPRYKAIGNSMAVPVMRWIGQRIASCIKATETVVTSTIKTPKRNRTGTKKEPKRITIATNRAVFKWAGGKFKELDAIAAHMPTGERLIEPFVGGGSVFLNLDYPRYLCADFNGDLINAYTMIQQRPDQLLMMLRECFTNGNTRDYFESVRLRFNDNETTLPALDRAVDFIYLNRHCFNGLMRYNLKGKFNVSFGRYKKPYLPEPELAHCLQRSSRTEYLHAPFATTISMAGDGDVVYCDPPYEPQEDSAGFTAYATGRFTMADQTDLVLHLKAAYERGAKVVVTNSNAKKVVELYGDHGFVMHTHRARRCISSKGSTRKYEDDIIATLT